MAEIKSTLDLVMERTRHLSMSEEEKAGQRQRDFAKRLQGLLQKHSDGAASVDDFRESLAALQNELKIKGPGAVLRALEPWIDPDGDCERWFDLLGLLQPFALEPLRALVKTYVAKREALLENTGRRQLDDLARTNGISGSAVVPNPGADDAYREKLADLKREVQNSIAKVLQAAD